MEPRLMPCNQDCFRECRTSSTRATPAIRAQAKRSFFFGEERPTRHKPTEGSISLQLWSACKIPRAKHANKRSCVLVQEAWYVRFPQKYHHQVRHRTSLEGQQSGSTAQAESAAAPPLVRAPRRQSTVARRTGGMSVEKTGRSRFEDEI